MVGLLGLGFRGALTRAEGRLLQLEHGSLQGRDRAEQIPSPRLPIRRVRIPPSQRNARLGGDGFASVPRVVGTPSDRYHERSAPGRVSGYRSRTYQARLGTYRDAKSVGASLDTLG